MIVKQSKRVKNKREEDKFVKILILFINHTPFHILHWMGSEVVIFNEKENFYN